MAMCWGGGGVLCRTMHVSCTPANKGSSSQTKLCARGKRSQQVLLKLKRIHGHMMRPGGSFWDLGSGVGKLVIAAAAMHDFEVRRGAAQARVMEPRDAARGSHRSI